MTLKLPFCLAFVLRQCVRCDGHCLLEHKDNIIAVLTATLHFKCKEGADLAGYMLRHTLKALTLIYTKDYRSSAEGWDMPLSEHLPIRVSQHENFLFLARVFDIWYQKSEKGGGCV